MGNRPGALLAVATAGVLAFAVAAFATAPATRTPVAAVAPVVGDGSVSAPVVSVPAAHVAPAAAPAAVVQEVQAKAAPARAAFGEMKHVWQSLNNCGPASVVMALSTLGVDVSQETARIPLRGTNVLSGMGPQRVDGWVKESFGLRSVWRNNGTNDLLRRLVANGFAPMVTQWMQDPSVSRVAHWRVVRGYDDARSTFFVNDPMLGNMVPLSYQWFQNNWQPFSYRYMVIYDPADESLLKTIIGSDWNDYRMRQNFYERTKAEAHAHDTSSAWIAYGEASYSYGAFGEAVAAFERGMSLGSVQGVFTLRSSYPQALRAIGRPLEAEAALQRLATTATSSTVAAPVDSLALYLAFLREDSGGVTLTDQ